MNNYNSGISTTQKEAGSGLTMAEFSGLLKSSPDLNSQGDRCDIRHVCPGAGPLSTLPPWTVTLRELANRGPGFPL